MLSSIIVDVADNVSSKLFGSKDDEDDLFKVDGSSRSIVVNLTIIKFI